MKNTRAGQARSQQNMKPVEGNSGSHEPNGETFPMYPDATAFMSGEREGDKCVDDGIPIYMNISEMGVSSKIAPVMKLGNRTFQPKKLSREIPKQPPMQTAGHLPTPIRVTSQYGWLPD